MPFFFNEPVLSEIVIAISLTLIIESFSIVQRTVLNRDIDIKTQTKISVSSGLIAGVISIFMAMNGWGIWSLVWRTLIISILSTSGFWMMGKWKPTFQFSILSFKELFSFGSKLMLSGLLNNAFQNIYSVVIGKFFSAKDLGYFTRANNFSNLPSENLASIVQRVSYPVLSKIKDDPDRLSKGYRKLITVTMFISFSCMFTMAAVADSLILTLLGEKWIPSIHILQLLCFSSVLYPLHALNLNVINVAGRSDIFLFLEIIKKVMIVPVIMIGIFYSIEWMLAARIATDVASYFLNSYYSDRMISYSTAMQIRDLAPIFALTILSGISAYFIGGILPVPIQAVFAIQLIFSAIFILSFSEMFKLESYLELKTIIINKIRKPKI